MVGRLLMHQAAAAMVQQCCACLTCRVSPLPRAVRGYSFLVTAVWGAFWPCFTAHREPSVRHFICFRWLGLCGRKFTNTRNSLTPCVLREDDVVHSVPCAPTPPPPPIYPINDSFILFVFICFVLCLGLISFVLFCFIYSFLVCLVYTSVFCYAFCSVKLLPCSVPLRSVPFYSILIRSSLCSEPERCLKQAYHL